MAAATPVVAGTLAEQARMLHPTGQIVAASGTDNDTLKNLSFIGSSTAVPTIGQRAPTPRSPKVTRTEVAAVRPEREPRPLDPSKAAPPPSLRNPDDVARDIVATPIPPTVDFEKLVYETAVDTSPVMEKMHPLDNAGFQSAKESFIDMDAAAASVSCDDAPLPGLTDLPELPAVQEPAPEAVIPEVKLDTIERALLDDRAQYTEIFADSDDFLGRPKTNKFGSSPLC